MMIRNNLDMKWYLIVVDKFDDGTFLSFFNNTYYVNEAYFHKLQKVGFKMRCDD